MAFFVALSAEEHSTNNQRATVNTASSLRYDRSVELFRNNFA